MSETWRKCGKCDGKGVIAAFGHVAGGTCFDCKGRGGFPTTPANEAARKRRREQTEQKREAEREARYRQRLANLKAAGWTFEEVHANACGCADPDAPDHVQWWADFEEA